MAKQHWIAGAIKKPGALRRAMGVKGDKDIPAGKLDQTIGKLKKKAAGNKKLSAGDQTMLKRANLAKTLKSFPHKGAKEAARDVVDAMIQDVIIGESAHTVLDCAMEGIDEGTSGPTRMQIQKRFDALKSTMSQSAAIRKIEDEFKISDVVVNKSGDVVNWK